MDSVLSYVAEVAECTFLASTCVMILLCVFYDSPDSDDVLKDFTREMKLILQETIDVLTNVIPKVTSENLADTPPAILTVSNPPLGNIKQPIIKKVNNKKLYNTPKTVAPPVIGHGRKPTNVQVDCTTMAKSSGEKPIDKNNRIVSPAKYVQMKIISILNNMTVDNFQNKSEEMKQVITEKHFPWLSNCMVMDRLSLASSYHTVYLKFLDRFGNKTLNSFITSETVRHIRVLLKRDKRMANSKFGLSLNNLGHWLGMITIGKNRSITIVFGDLNGMLVKAYAKGDAELQFVVPFITNILESCAHSNTYSTKNPWTIGVLNCLSELYRKPGLNLILKIKIELLFKHLNVKLEDLNSGRCLLEQQSHRS